MKITAEELARKQRDFEASLLAFAEENDGEIPFDVAEGAQRISKSLQLEEVQDAAEVELPQVENDVVKGLETQLQDLQKELARLKGTPAPIKNQVDHKAPQGGSVRPVENSKESMLQKALNVASNPLDSKNAELLERVSAQELMKLCLIRGEKNGHVRMGSVSVTDTTRSFLQSVTQ